MGSIPTGRVLEIDTKTGAQREAVPAREGHAAIGLKYDGRRHRLFVSGGPTGKAFVYGASSGAELAAFQLTAPGQPTFINDVVLTHRGGVFHGLPAAGDLRGEARPVRRQADRADRLPDDRGSNNLNGIEAAEDGRVLLAVQSSEGVLWRIDPETGSNAPVDLHGAALTDGDGLLLIGERTLLVVQNRANQIAVVKLSKRFRSGRVVRTITHPDFDVPTTVASKRGSLYLPNARFTTPPLPDTDYWVTRVGGR